MTRLEILIAAIEKQEGFGKAGTIPTRMNNPGDLMFRGQKNAAPAMVKGADGRVRTYACFKTLADGLAGLRMQIALDASEARHESLSFFAGKYAPVADGNNTSSYLLSLMKALGETDPNVPLAQALCDTQPVLSPDGLSFVCAGCGLVKAA